VIVSYSWKMVFAQDAPEFERLLREMREIVTASGFDEVLAYDLKIAKELNAARGQARAEH
jgi:phenylalanyl-tRNA synthetase beta subunit